MPDKGVPCQVFADPLPWPLGRCLQRSGRGFCQFRRIRIPREDGAQQLSSFNARVSKCATQQLSVRPANGCERSPRRHQPGSQRWPSAAPILSIRRRAIISGGPSRRYRHDDFDWPVREACAARRMNNWPMHAEKAPCIFCSISRIKDSSALRWRTERGKTNPSILPGLRLFSTPFF